MDTVTKLSGHWLEIITLVYLVGMILYGHYRGFIRLAVSALALIITLISVRLVLPYASEWIKNETPVYEMIQSSMEKAVGIDDILPEESEETDTGEKDREAENAAIGELNLPGLLKQALVSNNTDEVYQQLGVELFRDYIGSYLAETGIQILTFFLLFVIIYILLRILVVWLDLVARLPILSGMNQIAGAVLGGAEALAVIWILCLLFTALSGTTLGTEILNQIEESRWLTCLYQNNLLAYFFVGLLSTIA